MRRERRNKNGEKAMMEWLYMSIVFVVLFLMPGCGMNGNAQNSSAPHPTLAQTVDLPAFVSDTRILLIGINKYPGGNQLDGCVPDIEQRWKPNLIRYCGFQPDQMRTLEDADAITANVKNGMEWAAQAGKLCLIVYSGHGALAPPEVAGGTEVLEVICPVDFDWTPEHWISNKDFQKIGAMVKPGVTFAVFFDSCHSGNFDRAMSRGHRVVAKNRHFSVSTGGAIETALRKHRVKKTRQREILSTGQMNVQFIAGCGRDQTSADTQDDAGIPGGAATIFFWKALVGNFSLSLTDVVKTANIDLHAYGYDQVEQADGAQISKPFLKF